MNKEGEMPTENKGDASEESESGSNSNSQKNEGDGAEGKGEGKSEGETQHKRYKYCCRKCKHPDKGRKACVCVVPLSQRRSSLGGEGCQACGCKGCSIEDFISRGEDPQYKPKYIHNHKNQLTEREKEEKFDKKNGCCRKCMKAFSKIGKSCICQVPQSIRKTKLTAEGCKICGCHGCNPRDHSDSFSQSSYQSYRNRRQASRDRSRSGRYSSRSPTPISSEERDYNFNNIDNSLLGKIVILQYGLFPGMLGLGVPQRTASYIFGRPV